MLLPAGVYCKSTFLFVCHVSEAVFVCWWFISFSGLPVSRSFLLDFIIRLTGIDEKNKSAKKKKKKGLSSSDILIASSSPLAAESDTEGDICMFPKDYESCRKLSFSSDLSMNTWTFIWIGTPDELLEPIGDSIKSTLTLICVPLPFEINFLNIAMNVSSWYLVTDWIHTSKVEKLQQGLFLFTA